MVIIHIKSLCDTDTFHNMMHRFNIPSNGSILNDIKSMVSHLIYNDTHQLTLILNVYRDMNKPLHDRIVQFITYVSIYEADSYTISNLILYTKQHTQLQVVVPHSNVCWRQYKNIVKDMVRMKRIIRAHLITVLCDNATDYVMHRLGYIVDI